MARFTAQVAMRWSDMDAYGHVNNVQFLTYVEEARVEMFKSVPWAGTDPLEAGIVVAESEIKYLNPLQHRHAPVPIDVWVASVGAAHFRLRYEVHDLAGDPRSDMDEENGDADRTFVYAIASSVMVPYDFAVGRPRRLRTEEKDWLAKYLEPSIGE